MKAAAGSGRAGICGASVGTILTATTTSPIELDRHVDPCFVLAGGVVANAARFVAWRRAPTRTDGSSPPRDPGAVTQGARRAGWVCVCTALSRARETCV